MENSWHVRIFSKMAPDKRMLRVAELVAGHQLTDAAEKEFFVSIVEKFLVEGNQRKLVVMKLRYGLGGSPPSTLQKIGDYCDVSRERARQIIAESIADMKRDAGAQAAA